MVSCQISICISSFSSPSICRVHPRPTDANVPRGPLGEALARQKHSPHRLAAGGRGEQEREGREGGRGEEKLGGEVNIEWREGEQVEVLVEERKAELDADDESNGETNLKQSGHLPKKKENTFEFAVEVEDELEDGGEEAEDGEEEERERQAYASYEREVEDEGRREVEDEGRREVEVKGRREVEDEGRQARASSVSALSVSGEKILAHRSGLHRPQ